ncbi:FAD:protein FMN transferase [Halomonas sp. C05BenzN]|uniref:FAD:protein FMN transferase n=1 Tax=Halomonas sp. C05BenzN TaxID=3411041 RepID=UPI003B932821
MTSLAARRYKGLACGPALFLFTLVMLPMSLLAGCRSQPPLHQFEGTALGTGYHITLHADLDDRARERLQAGIQGELVSLEQDLARLRVPLRHARGPLPAGVGSDSTSLAQRLLQMARALAVDRLVALLLDHAVEHAMIELGGMVRVRGPAGRRAWRLALDRAGMPREEGPRLRLADAALVRLDDMPMPLAGGERAAPLAASRLLAVSVVAPTTIEAERQARELMAAGPEALEPFLDRAVRIVVLTSQGIEIHHGSALETYLEE